VIDADSFDEDQVPEWQCPSCRVWVAAHKTRCDCLTAETVTDEQIRNLRSQTGWIGGMAASDQRTIAIALSTSAVTTYDAAEKASARARCAAIINAHLGVRS